MELIKHLGLGSNGPSVNTLVSACADAKTTLSCIIAGEYVKDGKNVLFIILEDRVKSILNKFGNILSLEGNKTTLKVKKINYVEDGTKIDGLKESINKSFEEKHYDVVIIDSGLSDGYVKDICNEISKENNCIVITTQQTRRIGVPELLNNSIKTYNLSEIVFSINKNVNLSFRERIKYFICYWKQKPNRSLNVLKSRYGKESSKNIFLDFEKVKITE